MRKRCILLVGMALILCALAALLLTRGEGRGILCRVSGGKNEMFVLGSIHVGSREMYPMSRDIREAIHQADVLVFECDTESGEAASATAGLMRYPDGETLSDHITVQTRQMLTQTAARMRWQDDMLESLKPWAITSMLSVESAAEEMGASNAASLGVETMVKKTAGEKPRLYLETAEEQLRLMDSFSPELQEYLLQTACESLLNPQDDPQLSLWPAWWAEGNAEAFAQSYLANLEMEREPELAREYHDSLITLRNERMARRLAELLEAEDGQRYFVTIGLMHLVLPGDSVLCELEDMGYKVEWI